MEYFKELWMTLTSSLGSVILLIAVLLVVVYLLDKYEGLRKWLFRKIGVYGKADMLAFGHEMKQCKRKAGDIKDNLKDWEDEQN